MVLAFLDNLSFGEALVLLIVAALIFGPSAARRAGRYVGQTTTGGFGSQPSGAPKPPSTSADPLAECYAAMEIPPNASMEQVRSAYKDLVKVWHPDRFGSDAKLRERATQKLQQINVAYEKICRARES